MHTVSKLTNSDVSEKLVETEMDGARLVLPGEGFVFENIYCFGGHLLLVPGYLLGGDTILG